MNRRSLLLSVVTSLIFIQSCALIGISFEVKNPKKPGKPQKFSREDILIGELSRYRNCYDVYFYDLKVQFFPDSKSLKGEVQMHIKGLADADTMQLDLHQSLAITSLTLNGAAQELQYYRQERAVFVIFPIRAGENYTLQVAYHGNPVVAKKAPWKGGFVWKKDDAGKPWIGVACESEGASLWWPLKDHTSAEPDSMLLTWIVPEGLTAVGNGTLQSARDSAGLSLFTWKISYPINTYNVTVYIGDYHKIQDEYTGINGQILHMEHYVLKKNADKAKEHFKQLHLILEIYEQLFGEYPWYNDGFKLVESPYAGMEHQTAIAYGNRFKNDVDESTDYIILHETAHEWWGNSVSAKDFAHVWIHEAFASYAEALYLEKKTGKSAYSNHMYFNRLFLQNKYPVVGVSDRRYFHFRKSIDVYWKGAWILHTFREQLDDDSLFFGIIRGFYGKYSYQTVETDDFIRFVTDFTGDDYSWFFQQYLYSNEVPCLEYAYSQNGIVWYRWANAGPEFDKLRLTLVANGIEFAVYPSGKFQTFRLPLQSDGSWEFYFDDNLLYASKKLKKIPTR
jgi:aminopeptidase N